MNSKINNKKGHWQFNVSFSMIMTFVALGIYISAQIIINSFFVASQVNNNIIEENFEQMKQTIFLLILLVSTQSFIFSKVFKLHEKYLKYKGEREGNEIDYSKI